MILWDERWYISRDTHTCTHSHKYGLAYDQSHMQTQHDKVLKSFMKNEFISCECMLINSLFIFEILYFSFSHFVWRTFKSAPFRFSRFPCIAPSHCSIFIFTIFYIVAFVPFVLINCFLNLASQTILLLGTIFILKRVKWICCLTFVIKWMIYIYNNALKIMDDKWKTLNFIYKIKPKHNKAKPNDNIYCV